MDYNKRLKEAFPDIKFLELYKNARTRIKVEYPCGHIHAISPSDIMKPRATGSKCLICNTNRKPTSTFSEELASIAPYLELRGDYKTAKTYVSVRDTRCGHEWELMPNTVLTRGVGITCPKCYSTTRAYTEVDIIKFLDNNYPMYSLLGEYINNRTDIVVYNEECKHSFTIKPTVLIHGKWSGACPICNSTTRLVSHEDFIRRVYEKFPNLNVLSKYTGNKDLVELQYECGHTHKIRPNDLLSGGHCSTCPSCFNNGTSSGEQEVLEYIKSIYVGEVIERDRDILEGKELDIVLPELGLAIEYNGEYFHSSTKKDKNYHLNKTIGVEEVEFQLIHIFEHEWRTKQDIVKSRLRSLLGKSSKIYARSCAIRRVEWSATKVFLDTNHIQGSGSPTSINYGLFLEDSLKAIMTFGSSRFNTEVEYELIRFCSLLNTSIIGGASKLLRAFEKDFTPKSLLSYASRSWSKGNLYNCLGFKLSHATLPGYFYIKGGSVKNRYACQKSKLKELYPNSYSDDLTEEQIMSREGYIKVHDSGNLVFIK